MLMKQETKRMGDNDPVYQMLKDIVGEDFVSNRQEERYIYSRVPSGTRIGDFQYLVLPKTVGEVREVVKMAGTNHIPIVPMGGGLSLADLTVPIKGGIVMDMKRMDRVLEVHEQSRWVLIEPGVTTGKLIAYLNKNYPRLRISVPDAPPSVTMCGNVLISGSGHLSRYGFHSDMINGLEVVLYTGEVCKLGSCSISPYWFSRSPLPDLSGLFINWSGCTGIVTKLSIKLYPKHQYRELVIFKIEEPESIPDAIQIITATGLMEDILIFAMKPERSHNPTTLLLLFITADSEKEMKLKKNLFENIFSDYRRNGRRILYKPNDLFPGKLIHDMMAEPKNGIEDTVDAKKGGGVGSIGAIFPLEKVPFAFKKGLEISEKYQFTGPLYTIRNIGLGHSQVMGIMYPFSRADEKSIDLVKKALEEALEMVYEGSGVPWKVSIDKQEKTMKKMDPGTCDLITGIKQAMDPQGIFNPGNWDKSTG
jgi:FAD/FMN-containing dehydrogenase